MSKILNKIWELIVEYRLSRFRKSPVIYSHNLNNFAKKYFRLKGQSKVISIGNLSFGGTGKTPLIITLVNEYLPKDKKIAIVAKGYKRADISDIILTKQNYDKFTIDQLGDEPLLLYNHLQIPIAISEKKYRAFCNIEKEYQPDITIIDDGFQHLWIERDLNILILDNKTLNNINRNKFKLMREPISSISRADLLLIPENQNFNYDRLDNYKEIIAHFRFVVDEIKTEFKFNESQRNNFIAFAGIANPKRFFNTLYELNIDPLHCYTFPDHHNYSLDDIVRLLKRAKKSNASLISTEKDLVKIQKYKQIFAEYKVDLYCLYIKFEIIEKDYLEKLIKEKLNV